MRNECDCDEFVKRMLLQMILCNTDRLIDTLYNKVGYYVVNQNLFGVVQLFYVL